MCPGLDPIKEVHALVGGFLKSHLNLTLENYVTYISLLYLYKHTCELTSCHKHKKICQESRTIEITTKELIVFILLGE